jgi:uncharacterized protein YbjT (DUF2867 family)
MKIVVIGGSGLIGTKVVRRLRGKGHEVVAASLDSGLNILTGEGLPGALAGAQVVVDVANSPSFETQAALDFFETAGRNLLAAEKSAGVRHHLALSIVGLERNPQNGYFRAKLAQERLIEASGIPYTILRSTQFFEFFGPIVESAFDGKAIRLSPALYQPIASEDAAATLADLALGSPLDSTTQVAGPEAHPLDEMARYFLAAGRDTRQVIADTHAPFFGAQIDDRSLTPSGSYRAGSVHFADWLSHSFSRPRTA